MRTRDVKAVFGETPESYRRRVEETLRRMEENEMKRKMRRGFVPALVLMLLLMMGIGYAAVTQWGGGADTRVEPAPTPTEPLTVFTVDGVEVTVTRAVIDGFTFTIKGEMHPMEAGVSLLPPLLTEHEEEAEIVWANIMVRSSKRLWYGLLSTKAVDENGLRNQLNNPNKFIGNNEFDTYCKRIYDQMQGIPFYGVPYPSWELLPDGGLGFSLEGIFISKEKEEKMELHLVTYRDGHAKHEQTTITIPVSHLRETTLYEGGVRLYPLPITIESMELTQMDGRDHYAVMASLDPGARLEADDSLWPLWPLRWYGDYEYLQAFRAQAAGGPVIYVAAEPWAREILRESVTVHITVTSDAGDIVQDITITK